MLTLQQQLEELQDRVAQAAIGRPTLVSTY
jgi:hypothetical protein